MRNPHEQEGQSAGASRINSGTPSHIGFTWGTGEQSSILVFTARQFNQYPSRVFKAMDEHKLPAIITSRGAPAFMIFSIRERFESLMAEELLRRFGSGRNV